MAGAVRRCTQEVPVKKGDVVPDFELPDETGTPRRLSELVADGPVVLYFYPAAMTAGCTKESCHFRDVRGELAALGAKPVGISADAVDRQQEFTTKHSFGFPLLSDSDRSVARTMGANRGLSFLPNRRVTFVIDTDRRVLGVIRSEVRMNSHADAAIEILKARAAPTPAAD
jgi:peroxiredoxin